MLCNLWVEHSDFNYTDKKINAFGNLGQMSRDSLLFSFDDSFFFLQIKKLLRERTGSKNLFREVR